MSIPTTSELRELFPAWGGWSHDAECWRVHPKCAMALACDEIDELNRRLEIAERALAAAQQREKALVDACKSASRVLAMQGNGHGPTWKKLDDAIRPRRP